MHLPGPCHCPLRCALPDARACSLLASRCTLLLPAASLAGACCAVLYKRGPGEACTPVPVWDLAGWVHPGGAQVIASFRASLCHSVRYHWLGKGAHATQGVDPEVYARHTLFDCVPTAFQKQVWSVPT